MHCLLTMILDIFVIPASTVEDSIRTARSTGKSLIEKYEEKLRKYKVRIYHGFHFLMVALEEII